MTSFLDSFAVDPGLDAAVRAQPRSRRRAARGPTEAVIKAKVIAHLKELGGYAIPKHQTSMGVRGTPDVMACLGGRMVMVETKVPGKNLEPDQRAELRKWQNAGALAGWACSLTHLDELLSHLNDPAWRNDFDHPGDGRGAGEPW